MADSAMILERMRNNNEHVEGFVSLLVETYLERPWHKTVAAKELIPAVITAFQETVSQPGLADWIEGRVEMGRKHYQPGDHTPRSAMPPNFPAVLKTILSQSKPPDRALARAVLHNDGMRDLMRAILSQTLSEFGTKIWDVVPGASARRGGGGGFGSRLAGLAKGVVSAVGDGLERQVEEKVDAFLDGAMDKVLDRIVDRVVSPPKGTPPWQPMLLDALIDQPFARFYAEADKVPPATSAKHIQAMLATWAHWEGLESELVKLYEHREGLFGEQTLRDLLAGSGLEESWRALIEEQLSAYAQEVVATDGFATWLDALVGAPAGE